MKRRTFLAGVISVIAATKLSIPNIAEKGISATLNNEHSGINDIYTGAMIVILSGAGVGQVRRIMKYNGATKVATIERAWATVPDSTSTYMIPAVSQQK